MCGTGWASNAYLVERIADAACGGNLQHHPESLRDKAVAVLERAMGIEPTSLAWEARVMAIIRRPQSTQFYKGFS